MATAIQNQITSTRKLSELLVLSIVSKLGSASLADVHRALRGATSDAETTFYIGKPLRVILEDSAHVYVKQKGVAPKYALTLLGQKTTRDHARVVMRFFPHLQKIAKTKTGQR